MTSRELADASAIVGTLAGALIFAIATVLYAPQVGGEFWPYILSLAVIVAAGVGANVGYVAGPVLLLAYVMVREVL